MCAEKFISAVSVDVNECLRYMHEASSQANISAKKKQKQIKKTNHAFHVNDRIARSVELKHDLADRATDSKLITVLYWHALQL